jgi:hypothetical protein
VRAGTRTPRAAQDAPRSTPTRTTFPATPISAESTAVVV